MVDIIVEQGLGKYNKKYPTVKFQFDPLKDEHYWHNHFNYMPKHDEIAEYLQTIILIEPKAKKMALLRLFTDAMHKGLEGHNYEPIKNCLED